MLDPLEQQRWFEAFLDQALDSKPRRPYNEAAAWAISMALIAEQFIDNDDVPRRVKHVPPPRHS